MSDTQASRKEILLRLAQSLDPKDVVVAALASSECESRWGGTISPGVYLSSEEGSKC
jgi:hypothetical protein